MDCAVIPALSLPPLGQAIIARCVKDAAWIRSGTAQSVVELFLVTVERRMAIRPLSSSLLTSYFEVVELAMTSDFPAASLPTCKQVPQVGKQCSSGVMIVETCLKLTIILRENAASHLVVSAAHWKAMGAPTGAGAT